MTYRLIYTSSFKKDVRLAEKRHLDMNALTEVLEWLKSGKKLPRKILRPPAEADSFFSDSTYKLPKKSHFTLESKELDFSVRHSMVLRIP